MLEEPDPSRKADTTDTSYIDDVSTMCISPSPLAATHRLQERTDTQAERATHLQLRFAQGKSDLIHLRPTAGKLAHDDASRKASSTIFLRPPNREPHAITPSKTITYLGVLFDERLSFKPHAMAAASNSLQTLGRLRHLRTNQWGGSISLTVCRHLTFAAVLPKMLWASPFWWSGTPTILGPLELTYNTLARWVTGLPKTTAIPKLLAAAHLPPLSAYLDYLSTRYAIRLHFLPESHPFRSLIKPPPPGGRSPIVQNYPSLNRILGFADEMVGKSVLEDRSSEVGPHGYSICGIAPTVHVHKTMRGKNIHRQ